MTYINVTLKEMDEQVYRQAKAIAAEENEKITSIVIRGLKKVIEERKHNVKKINKNDPFFRLIEEGVDCGIDTDVRNADKYIYQ